MLLPYHTVLKSKQTHARLDTLTSLSRIEGSSPITTIFEVPQGFTHPMHIEQPADENILLQWNILLHFITVGRGWERRVGQLA